MKLSFLRFIPVGMLAILLVTSTALAQKPTHSVTLPPRAQEVASGVYALGSAVDPQSGKVVQGYMIVRNRPETARGGSHGSGGGGAKTDPCYAFLAKGAKWKTTEDYVIDPTNNDGISASDVATAITTAANTWDAQVAATIFGSGSIGTVNGVDESAPDGVNEILFGSIPNSPGTVAVTTVWGIFGGNPSSRELVEWDQLYNDAYQFGDVTASGNNNLMDLLDVATHEVGHAAGMAHPSDSCTQETMYRFVNYGETLKQDLGTGDIAGIKALY